MDPVGPASIPFHVARAYGVQQAAPTAPARPVQPVSGVRRAGGPLSVAPLSRPQTLRMEGAAEVAGSIARSAGPSAVSRLVAATVPGGIDFRQDFSTNGARPAQPAHALYRHPADRNAAATGVSLGRHLDAEA